MSVQKNVCSNTDFLSGLKIILIYIATARFDFASIREQLFMRFSIITILQVLIYISSIAQTDIKKNSRSSIEAADSIGIFYKALFKTLKVGYLDRKKVDWKSLEVETYKNLQSYKTFESSLKEITIIFDKISAKHCLVYKGNDRYTATSRVISKDLYSAEWKTNCSLNLCQRTYD
ncbi:hypothetical protein [Pedobacter agri]|uniref:hypothetical protein n=1 Tax=Pedobacter agri TaxID=454586 RepID=UPI0029314493|nr:hypothetical protein [Pedobacter agri]